VRPSTLVLAIVLAMGSVACSPPPIERATQDAQQDTQPSASGPRLEVGEIHVYTLDWQTRATRSMGAGRVSGGLSLRGELALSAIEKGPEGTRVSLWFPSLPTRTIAVLGEPIELDAAQLVDVHAELLIAPDGDVRRAFFAPESAPIFRELMAGVIARVDFRAAIAGDQPRAVRGGHGLVEVVYTPNEAGVVTRELRKLLRFDSAPGLEIDEHALIGEGRIELDDHQVPVRIELHDRAQLEQVGLDADDRFTLVRLRVDLGHVEALPDPVEIDPSAAPDPLAAARELDRQFAEGLTYADIEVAMDVMDGGVLPRQGFVSRASALLRGWPEQTDTIIPLALEAGGNGRQLAFDLLAAAGTLEAQAAMRSLLQEPVAAGWPERNLLLGRFAFLAAPSPESAQFLLDQLAAARAADQPESMRALLYPIGTVSGRVADPTLATQMHQALLQAAADEAPPLRAAGIAGLGNARQASDIPRLITATTDLDTNVRVEAVAALRTHVRPEATQALLEALTDPEPAVASRALDVLHERHFEGQPTPEFIARAQAGRYNPNLDRAMASALIGSAKDPKVREALATIATRTQDSSLTTDLQEFLAK